MRRIAVLCIIGVLFLANVAMADDYNPPSWRGMENTTFQQWEFGTETALTPDLVDNPAGTPTLSIAGSLPYTAWLADDYGHSGVWKFEDYIQIDIPNFDNENPLKEIWIQLTYTADSIGQGLPPSILTNPSGSTAILENQEAVDGLYWHETYSLIIEPNPDSEIIWISPRNCTLYVDELVIDTICRVPEPTTICLLGLGGLALLRRRRSA